MSKIKCYFKSVALNKAAQSCQLLHWLTCPHGNMSLLLFAQVFYIWAASGFISTIKAVAAFSSFIASAQFSK